MVIKALTDMICNVCYIRGLNMLPKNIAVQYILVRITISSLVTDDIVAAAIFG